METSHRTSRSNSKFIHTENERFFEEQDKVAKIVLSLIIF